MRTFLLEFVGILVKLKAYTIELKYSLFYIIYHHNPNVTCIHICIMYYNREKDYHISYIYIYIYTYLVFILELR